MVENMTAVLSHSRLFSGIAPDELEGLLHCLRARRIEYAGDALIIEQGETVSEFGILLSGHGRSIKWDVAGRLTTITLLEAGSEIGVMLAADSGRKSPVSVQTQGETSVLWLPFEGVLARCGRDCPRHGRLLRNYISAVAEKGLVLHERMDCLLKPTAREKILTYLVRAAQERQSRTFFLPLNRAAMAEYLNMERSALSRELSRMKADGIIDYHKNCFRLNWTPVD